MPKEPLTHRISDIAFTLAGVTFAVATVTLDAMMAARRTIAQTVFKKR
jgi:hypothetical protein